MRLTTLLRRADPLRDAEEGLSPRARAELRALIGPEPATAAPGVPDVRVRRPGSRRVLVASGAALATVAVLASLLLQYHTQGVPTVSPAVTSGVAGATGEWTPTASDPLPGRRDAITAWVDDSFLLLGGTTAPPCADASDCPDDDVRLRDGARYRPASDSWTPIAAAPIPLRQGFGQAGPYPASVTLGHTVYLLQGDAFLGYDADADRWRTLPAPPDSASVAGVIGNRVVAYPWSVCPGTASSCVGTDRARFYSYDPDAATWATHVTRLAMSSTVYGAVVAGGKLVVSWPDEGQGVGVATVDLASGVVGVRTSLAIEQRPVPVAVGDRAAWPRDASVNWVFDPATEEATKVETDAEPGPFWVKAGAYQRNLPIVTAGMISLGGHLYDPRNGLWSATPALPVPAQDPVIATGLDAVLACHGWNGSGYADACYLLRPAPASQQRP
ncbi:MAG: hypothetical protein QM619_10145 [Micropruina sp.]|uniref:hypothetical protein n=1 Tax=Micropruina sp. TaxID=2737536 RepID=UPI0039E6DEB5